VTQQPYGPPPGQYPQQPPVSPPWTSNPANQPAQGPAWGQQAPLAPTGQRQGFNKPGAPTGGGETVNVHQLEGRLVLFRVTSWDPDNVSTQGGENAKPGLLMAEAIIMDGPPIPGALNGMNGQLTPFESGPKVPPFYVNTLYIRGAVMPRQLADYAPSRGLALGRVVKGQAGTKGKPPWVLQDATEQDEALAYSIVGPQILEGFNRIKAAAAPAPTVQQFGQPQQAPAGYPQPTQPPVQQTGPAQGGYPQPQPYQQPTPQQYPPAGPPAAPWAQPQQAGPPPPWAQG
jgi:hypothetical protein